MRFLAAPQRFLRHLGGAADADGGCVPDRALTPLPSAAVSLITPTAQNGTLVSPTHEIFNRLLRERIIFLGTEVDDDIANVICAQLLHLAGDDAERDVWLYINSPGGSVTAGMAIYDTMQFIEPDVATVCMGLGASMGQFLLLLGRQGQALRPAARPHHDAPALGRLPGPGGRHRHPGRAAPVRQAAHGRAHRLPHRARASSRSPRTPSATGGSRPSRPRTTASSTT